MAINPSKQLKKVKTLHCGIKNVRRSYALLENVTIARTADTEAVTQTTISRSGLTDFGESSLLDNLSA